MQGWWRAKVMLCQHLSPGPLEWGHTTEPLIDNNRQGILIAGRACLALHLFWCQIGCSAYVFLGSLIIWTLEDHRDAKVAEQHLIARVEQHIFGLDASMDALLPMRKVQGIGHLPDIRQNGAWCQGRASGKQLAQRAVRGIV